MRLILIDSKKSQKGVMSKANNMPKINGIKKGAPKCRMAKTNMIKNSIVLSFVNLYMVQHFLFINLYIFITENLVCI